jgi:glycosyltransferase involved in cell wall biosynthesis
VRTDFFLNVGEMVKVLYYGRSEFPFSGPSYVAYYLSRALEKRANMTYYPQLTGPPKRRYAAPFSEVISDFFQREFDVAHFNFCPTLVNGSMLLMGLARRVGTATLMNVHGVIQMEQASQQVFRIGAYSNLFNTLIACRTVDAIVANTEYMRTNVATWYRTDKEKIVVIPNGVDIKLFNKRKDGSVLDGDPKILYVGSLSWTKGIDILIRAVARVRSDLPGMRLHLVGPTTSFSEEIRLLIRKEGVEKEVLFHNYVPHSILPRYYGSADICIFPSRLESFGLVILEAMASGAPIVASNIPSFREILSDGESGLLFESGNDEALSKAISTLVGDPLLRKRVCQAALQVARKYSWENIAQRYLDLYNQLCGARV